MHEVFTPRENRTDAGNFGIFAYSGTNVVVIRKIFVFLSWQLRLRFMAFQNSARSDATDSN